MQRTLRDQCIVIFLAEIPCRVQCARDDADSLKLRPRITDGLLVYGESLRKVLVCDLFEVVLICNLTAGNEEAKREISRSVDTGVEC
jgi:hypothetical protein